MYTSLPFTPSGQVPSGGWFSVSASAMRTYAGSERPPATPSPAPSSARRPDECGLRYVMTPPRGYISLSDIIASRYESATTRCANFCPRGVEESRAQVQPLDRGLRAARGVPLRVAQVPALQRGGRGRVGDHRT